MRGGLRLVAIVALLAMLLMVASALLSVLIFSAQLNRSKAMPRDTVVHLPICIYLRSHVPRCTIVPVNA